MFDGEAVSPILPYVSLDADRETAQLVAKGNGRISLSGVQAKYSMVVDNGILRLTENGELGRYILKPAPTATFILDRRYCPENECLTMHIASEIFGIETAECCLCQFQNGEKAFLVKRFDIAPAYDLMNTAMHLAMPSVFAMSKGLFREGTRAQQ